MVFASGRWFSVRVDFLCTVFLGFVAAMCVVISLNAGMLLNHNNVIAYDALYDLIHEYH